MTAFDDDRWEAERKARLERVKSARWDAVVADVTARFPKIIAALRKEHSR